MSRLVDGVAAAAVPGVLSAVVTRGLMALVATLVNLPSEFHLGATLSIPVVYVVLLLPGCVALAHTRRWWAWLLFGAGVAVLLENAVSIGLEETASAHGMTPWRWLALIVALLAMAATYAAHVVVAARWARRAAGSSVARRRPTAAVRTA